MHSMFLLFFGFHLLLEQQSRRTDKFQSSSLPNIGRASSSNVDAPVDNILTQGSHLPIYLILKTMKTQRQTNHILLNKVSITETILFMGRYFAQSTRFFLF